jgi:hypothetical protein
MKTVLKLVAGFFFLLFGCLWSGCMPSSLQQTNVLLMDVRSTNCPKIGQCFEYENDSISVTYSFWEMNGTIEMLIRNKLNQPIYIDWKKCSFITGETKHDYWDGTMTMTTNGSAFTTLEDFANRSTAMSSISQITKPERITFIPPGTIISMAMHTIAEKKIESLQPGIASEKDTTLPFPTVFYEQHGEMVPDLNSKFEPKKFTLLYSEFDTISTPISFRTFLTYSTNDKFITEAYIDNFFYVSQINQMPIEAFQAVGLGTSANKNEKNIWATPSSFYTY